MRILGINCMNHDASMSVVDGREILWAAHSERYSRVKNDHFLNWKIVNEAMTYGPFDKVVYYERPWLKTTVCRTMGRCFKLHGTTKLAFGSLWDKN
jgi:carbamoyltransferase